MGVDRGRMGESGDGEVTEGAGGDLGVLFEEVNEVGTFFKAQAPGDLADIPIGMAEEIFCFLGESFGDMAGGRFSGCFPEGAVEMVYMYSHLRGVLGRGAKSDLLGGGLDGKLTFEEFRKQRRDAYGSVGVGVDGSRCRLHLEGQVYQFKDEVAQGVVFVSVVGADLRMSGA